MKKRMTESYSWDDFNFPNLEKFLPNSGEGNSKAEQISTAANKIIYKWFNDGDVYDNQNGWTDGFYNDISSYANWLYYNLPGAQEILGRVEDCYNEDDYVSILYDLGNLAEESIESFQTNPPEGTVYDCSGPFEFIEPHEDEDEDEENYYDTYDYEDSEDSYDESVSIKRAIISESRKIIEKLKRLH